MRKPHTPRKGQFDPALPSNPSTAPPLSVVTTIMVLDSMFRAPSAATTSPTDWSNFQSMAENFLHVTLIGIVNLIRYIFALPYYLFTGKSSSSRVSDVGKFLYRLFRGFDRRMRRLIREVQEHWSSWIVEFDNINCFLSIQVGAILSSCLPKGIQITMKIIAYFPTLQRITDCLIYIH